MATEDSSTPLLQEQGNYGTQQKNQAGQHVNNGDEERETDQHQETQNQAGQHVNNGDEERETDQQQQNQAGQPVNNEDEEGETDQQQQEVEIESISDFETHAGDCSHFAVERNWGCCSYRHHFLTLRQDRNNILVVHYNDSILKEYFGIGEVQSEIYELDEKKLKPLVHLGKEKCFLIMPQEMNDELKRDKLLRIMEKMGERFYDLQTNNCENLANYVSHHKDIAPDTKKMKIKAFFSNLFIADMKSFGLLATLLISFVGIALSSIVRQSYVRIFIAMFISFKRQDSFDVCTNSLGKNIIDNANDRIKFDLHPHLDEYDKNILNNISVFLGSPLVCDKADQLGGKALLKSSIYLFVIWATLQTAFVLSYNYLHLKTFRRVCLTQNKLYLYRKYLYKEIFGGYIPIFSTVGLGVYFQKHSTHPLTAYFICLCVFAMCVRVFCISIVELMFERSALRARHDICCAVFMIVVLILTYLAFVIFHYTIPVKFDPF